MRQNLTLRVVVSVSALLIAAAHVWRPEAKIDSITIVLLVICALPWLQPLIKTVELLGLKLELQDLQDKVAEARGAAESATRLAGLALSASTAPVPGPPRAATGSADSDIEALAREYEEVRETQRSGDARTAAMTGVVRRMIDVARRTESFDIRGALADEGRGMRLFAYAYLYARPNPQFLLPLVEVVTTKEDKPFGQYWGLQSVGRVMSNVEHMSPEIKSKLQAFGAQQTAGTDREYELKKLLRHAG